MIKTTKLEREVIEVRLKDSFDKSKHAEVKTTLDVITDYNKIEEAVIKLHRKYEDLFVTEYRYKKNYPPNNKNYKKQLDDERLSFMVDFNNFIDLFSNLSDIQDQKIETDDVLKQLGWEAIRGTENHGVYSKTKAAALKASAAQISKLTKILHSSVCFCFQCGVNQVASSNTLCQSCLYQSQSSNANANAKPCARCQAPHTSTGSHCSSCRACNASRSKKLCMMCKQNQQTAGTLCDQCYWSSAKSKLTPLYSQRIATSSSFSSNSMCVNCNQHPQHYGEICKDCYKLIKMKHYSVRNSRRTMCTVCNSQKAEPGEIVCQSCSDLQQQVSIKAQQLSKSATLATPVSTPATSVSYPTPAQIKSVVAANFNVKSSQTAPVKKNAIQNCFDYILKLISM